MEILALPLAQRPHGFSTRDLQADRRRSRPRRPTGQGKETNQDSDNELSLDSDDSDYDNIDGLNSGVGVLCPGTTTWNGGGSTGGSAPDPTGGSPARVRTREYAKDPLAGCPRAGRRWPPVAPHLRFRLGTTGPQLEAGTRR